MKFAPTLITLLLPIFLSAQVGFTGEVFPDFKIRTSDADLINLPVRLATTEVVYSLGDFDFRGSIDLEARWKAKPAGTSEVAGLGFAEDQFSLSLAELYMIWYPSFGEVKVGSMIHAWGAADANNPTDNPSPYDFYYMFLSGTDRKAANLGASVKAYLGNFETEFIYQPLHGPNRLPHGEPDFPIDIPPEPDEDDFAEMESEMELGARLQYAFGLGDVSASYFKGHDRMFSLFAANFAGISLPDLVYGYRETDVLGFDFVLFPGNWTVRGEVANFTTKNPYTPTGDDAEAWTVFQAEADYLQYVFQAEYLLANEMQIMAQIIGTSYRNVSGRSLVMPSEAGQMPGVVLLDEDNFQAGMGTPFAMISDRVAMISTLANFFDSSLELRGMVLINLEELEGYDLTEQGLMANLGATYSIMEGLNLEAGLIYFYGEGDNQFSKMKDFSHLRLGLSYHF